MYTYKSYSLSLNIDILGQIYYYDVGHNKKSKRTNTGK